jgi:uncharacterized protein YukE
MPVQHRGPDGATLHSRVAGELSRLSRLSDELGVTDLVEEYFTPLLGGWSAMHDEADRWRAVATAAEDVTGRLTAPLGRLDASWQGADADSFIAYMRRVGLAGHDLSDAASAVADVLDRTADALRRITVDLSDLLAEVADDCTTALGAPSGGPQAVRDYLDVQRGPVAALHGSACDVLDSFARFCRRFGDGSSADGVSVDHAMPQAGWQPTPQSDARSTVDAAAGAASTATAAASADDVVVVPSSERVRQQLAGGPAGGQAVATTNPQPPATPADPPSEGGRGGMGMMPMMGGMGGDGGKGGDKEHKSKLRITADPKEIFGEPEKTAPPVIGELPKKPRPKPKE